MSRVELTNALLECTPLYTDILNIIIGYITYNKFKVNQIYHMNINEINQIFYHKVKYRTKCYIDVDIFGAIYRKKIRYDEYGNEYIILYKRVLYA